MISGSIVVWFFVFGGLTSLLALQFLFPRWYSWQFNKIDAGADQTGFYARQAGLAIAVQGLLLIWAGFDPNLRVPAAVLVGGGKLVFVATILAHRKVFPGLLVSALIDGVAVLVFGLFLAGL